MRQSRTGGVIRGMMIALGLLAACALFLVIGVAHRVAENVRFTESAERGETRLETPFGSLRVRERGSLDPKSIGVPVYPGAERVEDGRRLASFSLDIGDHHKDLTVASAEYITRDSISAVEAYYRDQLPDVRVKRNRNRRLVFEIGGGPVRKVVSLREKSGRTHISLASMTEAAAN